MAARTKRVQPGTVLGRAIYETRVARGMSTATMAAWLGLKSHTSMVRWEAGREEPAFPQLLRIGALATGEARRTIVEACRARVLAEPYVREVQAVMTEVAG
jgi:DNA-binding XRE family transcriptional regulator